MSKRMKEEAMTNAPAPCAAPGQPNVAPQENKADTSSNGVGDEATDLGVVRAAPDSSRVGVSPNNPAGAAPHMTQDAIAKGATNNGTNALDTAPIQAHSKSQYKRLVAQGANVSTPDSERGKS